MSKTKAATVTRAAEKAQRADRRVTEAERALKKAQKARDRAEALYLSLIQESFPARTVAPSGASQEALSP